MTDIELTIDEHVKKWNEAENPKPCNDADFIKVFIEFIAEKGSEDFEFSGENGYCGNTAIVYDINPKYSFVRSIAFEFAYGSDFVKVFTAHHNGFWVPEYIDLSGDDASQILSILREKFMAWGGFDD